MVQQLLLFFLQFVDFHLLNESFNGAAFSSSLLLVVGSTGNVCIWKDFESNDAVLVSSMNTNNNGTANQQQGGNNSNPSTPTTTTIPISASFSSLPTASPPQQQPQQQSSTTTTTTTTTTNAFPLTSLLQQPKLVNAFRAVPELSLKHQESPVILSQWHSYHGLLYITGDRHVKIWDIERESCIQSVPFEQADHFVIPTSMACDTSANLNCSVAMGFADGTVCLYDKRLAVTTNKPYSCAAKFKEHKQPIINMHIQKINNYQLITGSASGDIKFWDTRFLDSSIKTFEAHKGCTALAIHDYAPVMASGSNNQFVKVFNTNGDTLSMIYYHDGFLGQRIGNFVVAN